MSSFVVTGPAACSVLGRILQALSAMAHRSRARRNQRRLADAAVVMGV